MSGISKTSATNVNTILFSNASTMSVGVVVSSAGAVEENGKKLVKAGTPLAGSLEARTTAFTKATGSDAVGVLLHDVDVTKGNGNGTLLIEGCVDLNKLDATTAGLITEEVKTALSGKVTFLK